MQTTTGHRQRGLAMLLVATTVLLGGCGFQLRGVGNSATLLPEEWKQMHLVTNNPNSEFSREVSARFELNGVTWAERADANYVLLLGPEDFQQRNLSLNSEARAAEFELTMRASFTVQTADGRVAMRQTTSSVVKQMENDPRNVVGKSEEIRLLQQEMRAELAQRILRSIGFYAASARAESADPG